MKKLLITLSLLICFVISANAATYSYVFEQKMFSANGTVALGDVEWTLAGDGSYWGYDTTKGQQFGSGSNPYKSLSISTTGITGTISEIKINTSGASSTNATANVTVGGEQFGESITLTKTATDYTFTGSGQGEIIIAYTQTSSKAIYIKSIEITYSESGEVTPTLKAPSFSHEECIFSQPFELTISNNEENADATIMYSFDNSSFSQYSSPITIPAENTTVYAYAKKEGYNNSSTVSVTFNYADPSTFVEYKLVTNASQLSVDANYIIASSTDFNMALSKTQNGNNRGQESVTIENNILSYTSISNVAVLTLKEGSVEGTYAFYDETKSGYLYAASSTSNYLRTETDLSENSSAIIAIEENGIATITFKGTNTRNILSYNDYNSIFSCYASGQKDVYIYKEVTDETTLENPYVKNITNGQTYYEDLNLSFYVPENAQSTVINITYNEQTTNYTYTPDFTFEISAQNAPGEYTIEIISTFADAQTTSSTVSFSVVTPIVVNYPKLDPSNVKEGRYIIAYTSYETSYILKNEVYKNYYATATEFDLTGEALPSSEYIFEITKGEEGYIIKATDGTYLALVVSGNYTNLKPAQETAFEWFFSGSEDAVEATGDGMEKYICWTLYNETPEFTAGTKGTNYFYPVFYRISDTPRDPLTQTVEAIHGYAEVNEDYINCYPEFDFTIAANYSDQIMVTAEIIDNVTVDAMKLVINSTDNVAMSSADAKAFSGTSTSEYAAGATIEFYFELTIGNVTVKTQTYSYQMGGDTMTGICVPQIQNNDNSDVYSIDGLRILRNANADEINALPKGLYIIKGKKVIIK